MGIVPLDDLQNGLLIGATASQVLETAMPGAAIAVVANAFAFFAILTSFLGVSLSFVDFLSDGLQIKKEGLPLVLLCVFVIVPPALFASVDPTLFLQALNYAGGYGAMLIFGLLPIAMAYSGRYYQKRQGVIFLPGGKLSLAILLAFSIIVISIVSFGGLT